MWHIKMAHKLGNQLEPDLESKNLRETVPLKQKKPESELHSLKHYHQHQKRKGCTNFQPPLDNRVTHLPSPNFVGAVRFIRTIFGKGFGDLEREVLRHFQSILYQPSRIPDVSLKAEVGFYSSVFHLCHRL